MKKAIEEYHKKVETTLSNLAKTQIIAAILFAAIVLILNEFIQTTKYASLAFALSCISIPSLAWFAKKG